ncbi:DMT family protein [Paracoccus luteus]|uniref:DMT family protein n=1 Tax=Paracoccus luteus TaxID=2508543 RepID=UPI00106FAAD5|nr:DMT family protein [Paracoccus luteus]
MGLSLPVPVVTVGLLVLSNLFMTLAWYGHLRFKAAPLVLVIAVSWLIALPEYALQVPANRAGHGHFSAAQLKTIQEVISLTVFAGFSWLYLGEKLGWQHGVGFALICAGAWFVFHDWG